MSVQSATKKNPAIIYYISALAAIAGMLFGYDTGVISGAILFIKKEFVLSPLMNGVIVSAVLLGALISSGVSGRFTDFWGRRNTLMLTSIIFIFASIASALSQSIVELLIARLFLGFAIGIASYTAPLYLAEIAPSHIRGFLVSLNQLAITLGIVLSYIIDYIFSPDHNWRMMLGFGAIPGLILFTGLLFLPESPRWLMLKGYTEKATKVLQQLRASKDVKGEIQEIHQAMGIKEASSLRALFTISLRPILYISFGLAFFQQVTGINTIIYYAPTIFEMAGFQHANSAILATLGIGIINILFTLLAIMLLDRVGRRPLLLIGTFAMFISLVFLGAAFEVTQGAAVRYIALASMIIYIAGFAVGLGPAVWLIISEIFPLNVRSLGTSISVSGVWAFNMCVALTFLTLIHVLGKSHTFWLYAAFCLAGWIFIYRMVPETKGCTLEQIEKNLFQGRPARDLGEPVDNVRKTK